MSDVNDILYDKEVSCPVCKKEFTSKKVRTSRLKMESQDSDFLFRYTGENPIKYNIFVCPHCGFAAYEDVHEKGIKDYFIKKIKATVSEKWIERDFGGKRSINQAIVSYKLALVNGKYMDISKLESANYCLNIAWLNRLKEDYEEEEKYLRFARDRFKDAYSQERLDGTKMTEARLTYLVGELSRRLNERKEALTWFGLCLSNPDAASEKDLLDMTREQLRLAKEIQEEV